MTIVNRGVASTLVVEWRLYAGGPMVAVTDVTRGIVSLADASVALATATTGVTNPGTGINTYTWTSSTSLAPGEYLITWTGTDPDLETVTATEVLTVVAGGALGGPYADRPTLKRRMGIPDSSTTQDADIDRELSSASLAINKFCGRQFGRVDVASERQFYAGASGIDIHDVYDLTGLTIDGAAYSTSIWTAEPLDGIRDGVPGWPYERLSTGWGTHPIYLSSLARAGALVTVSALWGWAAIPDDIESACLMLAADGLKGKDAPFGVAGFGDYVVRVRANPKVAELLAPYVREPVKVGT
jgi:hypothetical protein